MQSYRPLCRLDCRYSTGTVGLAKDGMPMTCIAVERLNAALHSVFGFRDFRPGQLDAMLPVLHGRDVFVRMTTGAGKSLAMFLVPLSHSPTAVGVIISPLISLMDEQVGLQHSWISAGVIVTIILDHKAFKA